jgi:GxxExxY protein
LLDRYKWLKIPINIINAMVELNKITYQIIGCAYKVHSALGPGLLESTYEACLQKELIVSGLKVIKQVPLPVIYRNEILDVGYRVDLIVEGSVIIELKAVDDINPVHKAQLLTYLKLSGIPLGLLINFNVKDMKTGITRMISTK